MSEKHPEFEIEPVNTVQSPEIKFTQTPQVLVPIDTPLSIIHKHIPRQSDIDKIVKNIETHVIHSLELPIQAQDLIKAYQHSTHFHDIYQYITDGKLPSSAKAQNCHTCLKTMPKYMKKQSIYSRIPVDYAPMQDLSIDIKTMPQAFRGYHLLLVITCDQTNFTIAVPLRDRTAQTVAEALIYRVIYLFGPPRQIICDEATEFSSAIIQAILYYA